MRVIKLALRPINFAFFDAIVLFFIIYCVNVLMMNMALSWDV